jgi:hypothetical protein
VDDPFAGVLFTQEFWNNEIPGRVAGSGPDDTKIAVREVKGGAEWSAEWTVAGKHESVKSKRPSRSVKEAKDDLRLVLQERRAEYRASRDESGPAKLDM